MRVRVRLESNLKQGWGLYVFTLRSILCDKRLGQDSKVDLDCHVEGTRNEELVMAYTATPAHRSALVMAIIDRTWLVYPCVYRL